jgi:hypothetical protein
VGRIGRREKRALLDTKFVLFVDDKKADVGEIFFVDNGMGGNNDGIFW